MKKLSIMMILFALCFTSGCGITIYRNTTKVVGQTEPMEYENHLARRYFELAIGDVSKTVESNDFGVPFFSFYESYVILSDEVHRNRQRNVCDSDGDGVISVGEAQSYYQKNRNSFDKSDDANEIKRLIELHPAE